MPMASLRSIEFVQMMALLIWPLCVMISFLGIPNTCGFIPVGRLYSSRPQFLKTLPHPSCGLKSFSDCKKTMVLRGPSTIFSLSGRSSDFMNEQDIRSENSTIHHRTDDNNASSVTGRLETAFSDPNLKFVDELNKMKGKEVADTMYLSGS